MLLMQAMKTWREELRTRRLFWNPSVRVDSAVKRFGVVKATKNRNP